MRGRSDHLLSEHALATESQDEADRNQLRRDGDDRRRHDGLQITNITSNQQTEDDAGGAGCGKPTATQGADFIFDNTPVTGTAGDDVDPVTTSVQVRAERCAKDKSGPRVYTIDVTCTDEGATDDLQLFVTVSHDNGHGH